MTASAGMALAPIQALCGNRSSTGSVRDLNPAISVNALLLYASGWTGEHDDHESAEEEAHVHSHAPSEDGFAVQETEIQLSASVDPYTRADMVFAMHGTEGFELEEGYVEATGLPRGFGLRLGKFYIDYGIHNTLHTHQYPFVERPVAWGELLGGEGLIGNAVELAWLTPLPWYAEVTTTAFPLTDVIYGDNHIPENKWGGAGRLRQLWDSSGQSTLQLGISYAGGELAVDEGRRHLIGADAAWKWSGRGANPRKAEIQTEWFRQLDDRPGGDVEQDGFYVHALGRVSRRISAGVRYDRFSPDASHDQEEENLHAEDLSAHDVSTVALSIAFIPSEFQLWRVEYLYRDDEQEADHAVRAQMNFTIGSHPAHSY